MWLSFSLSPSAGCGPPSPPVNGSVGEWTRAQVNYSCDTDLVLVGERVAYCSLPQLQWLPSSDDVVCVQQPPGIFILYYSNIHLFQPSEAQASHTPYHQPVYPLQALHLVNHYTPLSSILFFVVLTDQNERKISSLSTAEAVVTTAVVCVVCSFTAGLLLGVLLTQCHGHCHRKQK